MKLAFIERLRKSNLGTKIYFFLLRHHLDSLVLPLIHRKETKKTRLFFTQNHCRLAAVSKLFTDEQSRNAFASIVRFRQSYLRKDAPPVADEQYFAVDVLGLSKEEVFVDCGAFNGDTARQFVEKTQNQYIRIVCFEPDPSNFEQLAAACTDPRIVKVQAGVWSETTTLKFRNAKGSDSKVVTMESGDVISVPVVSIDEVPECQDATFIKMDIEGSEMNALLGAMKVIQRNRSKLAICIYHSDEDMLRIPEHLGATLDNYSFHVRHHTPNWGETVLYAVPN